MSRPLLERPSPGRYLARKAKKAAEPLPALAESATVEESADLICPRLFLSQRSAAPTGVKITAQEIRDLVQQARTADSEPGMLLQFNSSGEKPSDWALIPYSLFERLLAATGKQPA